MVQNDPYRKASAEQWKSDGEKVVWSEVVGVAEAGGGKNGTLTLGDASSGVGIFSEWTHSLSDGSAGECKPVSHCRERLEVPCSRTPHAS